jgi:hypothetical protein
VQIELRQHEDGTYVLEVVANNQKKEVDVTSIVQEIVVNKLKYLQTKLQLEERYRNWIVESAQETNRSLSTTASRYAQMQQRLKETNEAIYNAVDLWRKQKELQGSMMVLNRVADQNRHFIENDSALQNLEKVLNKDQKPQG